MSYFLPYFIIMPVFCAFASLPFFYFANSPPNPKTNHISNLDGLRGFLALGVFFDHSEIYRSYSETGIWKTYSGHFYIMLGESGVSLFFMITGYLFWKKLILESGKINFVNLYIGRAFRIGPLYIVTVSIMFLIVFTRTGFYFNDSAIYFLKNFLRWFSVGIFSGWDVNKYKNTWLILAFVTWTLYYEWRFYFSLLLLSHFTKNKWTHVSFSVFVFATLVIIALNCHVYEHIAILASLFCAGMLSASLEDFGFLAKLPNLSSSVLLVFILTIVVGYFWTAYSVIPDILLSFVFYIIISGCDIFGLLRMKFAIRLGNISYGIYLMQGFVLNVVFSVSFIKRLSVVSDLSYWTIITFSGGILICLATFAHVTIEQPGIKLGRHVSRSLRNPLTLLKNRQLGF